MHLIFRYAFLMSALLCLGNRQAFAVDVRPDCPPSSADDYFMPALSIPFAESSVQLRQSRRQWYSKHLRAMFEPSLSCGPSNDDETYRFLWLRTFHKPIAVRIVRSVNGVQLTAVELSGAGGYNPGSILKQIHKSLSADQWQTLISAIEACKYWSQPSGEDNNIGADGAQWIVEARRGHAYHVVDRWTPHDGVYHSLGLLFLDLAGLKPAKPDDIY